MDKPAGPPLSAQIAQLFRPPQNGTEPLAVDPRQHFSSPGLSGPGIVQTPVTATGNKPRSRRKLWQLEDKLHCPVIGTCVPLADLQALARRFEFIARGDSDFSLHVEAVATARQRTPFAEALQKFLDRRYHASLTRFDAARSDGEVRQLWRQSLAQGDVAGALWALVTHPAVESASRDQAYGDIHMLSHQVGAGQSADVRRLQALSRENAELKQALENQRQDQARRDIQWQERLRAKVAENDQSLAKERERDLLQQRLQRYESGTAMVDMGRRLMQLTVANEQLIGVADKARHQEEQLKAMQERLERTLQERDAYAAEGAALESLLMSEEEEACAEDCQGCDAAPLLEMRRILCVGGRSQLVSHYRRLAQKLGIKLVHHDGGLEESLSRLPDMINGADGVICPTDCVSHPAYYRIKSQCKRQGKPCLLFKGTGVSSFAAALVRVSSGKQSVVSTP